MTVQDLINHLQQIVDKNSDVAITEAFTWINNKHLKIRYLDRTKNGEVVLVSQAIYHDEQDNPYSLDENGQVCPFDENLIPVYDHEGNFWQFQKAAETLE